MAFTLENLTIATNNIKAGVIPSVWYYYNKADDLVTTADFFACARLTVGDQIQVVRPDNTISASYRVSAKSTDGFTATAIKIANQYLNPNLTETVTSATALYDVLSTDLALSLLVTEASGNTDTFTAVAATDIITTGSKSLTNGVCVVLTTVTPLPAGLSLATPYYVVSANGTSSKLSASLGGTAVDITDAGTGVHTMTIQANYFTLADGGEGQRKYINFKTNGTLDATVIPENFTDGTTLTFGTETETASLQFINGGWGMIDINGGVVA